MGRGKAEAKQWESEPLLLDAKDLKRILRVNQNHIEEKIYEKAFWEAVKFLKEREEKAANREYITTG